MSIYDEVFKTEEKYNIKQEDKIEIVKQWAHKYNDGVVLDVGCGRGHYLKALLADKIDVLGLEPSLYLCENDLKGFDVVNADINTMAQINRLEFSALYCMDVLEHISEEDIYHTLNDLTVLSDHALIGVANHSDIWLGKELHLIQRGEDWWLNLLQSFYKNVDTVKEWDRFYMFRANN